MRAAAPRPRLSSRACGTRSTAMRTSGKVRTIFVAIKELRATAFLDKAAHVALACSAELVLFHDLAAPVFVDGLGPGVGARAALRAGRRAVLARLETLAEP